jgi:hypothetical protein
MKKDTKALDVQYKDVKVVDQDDSDSEQVEVMDVKSQDLPKTSSVGGYRKEDSDESDRRGETLDGNQSPDFLADDSSDSSAHCIKEQKNKLKK